VNRSRCGVYNICSSKTIVFMHVITLLNALFLSHSHRVTVNSCLMVPCTHMDLACHAHTQERLIIYLYLIREIIQCVLMLLIVNGETKFVNGEKSEEAVIGWKLILQGINLGSMS